MPARQPFTALCRALAQGGDSGPADLHVHTYSQRWRLTPGPGGGPGPALRPRGHCAVTDHDTLDGVLEATAAAGTHLEVIPAWRSAPVYHERELHLLAYFVRLEDPSLTGMLDQLRTQRTVRFAAMVERLRGSAGCQLDQEATAACHGSLGRRHLAELLVRARKAGSVREAFQRYLGDGGRVAVPKAHLPVTEAIACVRQAGGVASLAHPSYHCTRETLIDLRAHGLGAVETEYPNTRPSRARELRTWAAELGLAVTGGSDCHGPEPSHRSVALAVSPAQLQQLRERAGNGGRESRPPVS